MKNCVLKLEITVCHLTNAGNDETKFDYVSNKIFNDMIKKYHSQILFFRRFDGNPYFQLKLDWNTTVYYEIVQVFSIDEWYVHQYKSLIRTYRELLEKYNDDKPLARIKAMRVFNLKKKELRSKASETTDLFEKSLLSYLIVIADEISDNIMEQGLKRSYGKHLWIEMRKYFDVIGIRRI